MANEFVDKYTKLDTPAARVEMLQDHYTVLAMVKIVTEQVRAVFGGQGMGLTQKEADGYKITVAGDDQMQGYLTYHEAMHVWLEETGRTVDIENENPEFRELLFSVKNLVNDFLIETEVEKKCGGYYADAVLRTKDRQVLGNIVGGGSASATRIVCEGFLTVALNMIYSGVENLGTVDFFTKGVVHPNLQHIIDLLAGCDAENLTGEDYEQLVAKVCGLMTMSDVEAVDGKIVLLEPRLAKSFIDYNNDIFGDLRGRLRG